MENFKPTTFIKVYRVNFFHMKNLILFTTTLFLFINTYGKPLPGREDYNSKVYWKAKITFEDADFKKSLLFFNYLLDQDPDNAELNIYVGLCYKRLSKEKIANYYLEKVPAGSSMMLKFMVEDFRSRRYE